MSTLAMRLPAEAPGASWPSLHARLRHVTADLHRRSEAALALPTKLADLSGYVSLLNILWRFHSGCEIALRRCRAELPTSSLCLHKAEWIVEDLSCFDRLPSGDPIEIVVGGRCDMLGCLYVVEGSMLGGRYIGKQAARALGVSRRFGGRFFDGYGAGMTETWSAFIAGLNRIPALDPDADRVEAASCRVFEIFISAASQ